jgi:hypothetical protein
LDFEFYTNEIIKEIEFIIPFDDILEIYINTNKLQFISRTIFSPCNAKKCLKVTFQIDPLLFQMAFNKIVIKLIHLDDYLHLVYKILPNDYYLACFLKDEYLIN